MTNHHNLHQRLSEKFSVAATITNYCLHEEDHFQITQAKEKWNSKIGRGAGRI